MYRQQRLPFLLFEIVDRTNLPREVIGRDVPGLDPLNAFSTDMSFWSPPRLLVPGRAKPV